MILLVNALNFAPEIVGCGKYTSEPVYWLTKKVDLVIVVTTNAYYPYWKCISNKYKKTKIDNLIIYRSIIFIPNKINGLNKLIHLASFFYFHYLYLLNVLDINLMVFLLFVPQSSLHLLHY